MNIAVFSISGYLSVLLWIAVFVLWVLHIRQRPRRWLCHYAVLVALVALMFAKINSVTYVNRIQIDRSDEIAAAQARQEAARRAAEAQRADEVAQVRFAEDDATDFLDTAGMDEADLKYLSNAGAEEEPAWKKEKKTRSTAPQKDDSLESMLDPAAEAPKGVDAGVVEKEAAEPIMMPERMYMLANQLDGMNLKWIRWLIVLGLVGVVLDYMSRANHYAEAYFPLPLPSRWRNGMTPLSPVGSFPETPRRSMREELEWITQWGDCFLYLTDDAARAAAIPEQAWRIPRLHLAPVDVIHVGEACPVATDFIIETIWYGRSSCVVDSAERARSILARMMELLRERKACRAHVRQTVQVVWDLSTPPPDELVAAFEPLGRATGVVLLTRPYGTEKKNGGI